MDKLAPLICEDRKSIENNIRVCLSANKCFVKVSFQSRPFHLVLEFTAAPVSLTPCAVSVRFQWFHIRCTARETTGSWSPVTSQPRWCGVTSKESCGSSPSWPPKWKRRTWAEHRSAARLSTLLTLQPAELFRSGVRWSSAVLSPSSPSWRETVPPLEPPELLLCPVCRSERSSSIAPQRGASAGTVRSLSSFKLQLEAQQGAAHTTDSPLMELPSPSGGCMCALRPRSPSPSTQEPVLLLISGAHTAVTSLTLYPHLPMMLSGFVCKNAFSCFQIALLYVLCFWVECTAELGTNSLNHTRPKSGLLCVLNILSVP